jgi:hypothetical protein
MCHEVQKKRLQFIEGFLCGNRLVGKKYMAFVVLLLGEIRKALLSKLFNRPLRHSDC